MVGAGGVLKISSDKDNQRIFFCSESLASSFLGSLDFVGYSKQSEDL